jgi:dTDP-4-dehydrorhamnose reductase
MNLLISGAGGQVGQELSRMAGERGIVGNRGRVVALNRSEMDVTDGDRVRVLIRDCSPAVVVNAAAYTAVDRAESEADRAFAVNRNGPRHLAIACAENGSHLIHISTDFVFDGKAGRSYREDDPVSPLGAYGRSKALGESDIRSILDRHLIVRTSWVYGRYGSNFVKTMIRSGRKRETLRVVNDQFGCPTSASDLAAALLSLAERIRSGETMPWGTYHLCGEGVATWHDLAEATLRFARRRMPLAVREIRPISASEYPTAAKRPPFSALDCARAEKVFGLRLRHWRDALGETVDALCREEVR